MTGKKNSWTKFKRNKNKIDMEKKLFMKIII